MRIIANHVSTSALTLCAVLLFSGGSLAEAPTGAVTPGKLVAKGEPDAQGPQVTLFPTSAKAVRIGSTIGFQIGATANGYAHLYALSASGKVQLWMENVRIRRDHAMVYPSRDSEIRATPPAGDEKVVLVITRAPFDGFASGAVRSPLALQYSHESFRQALAAKIKKLPSGSWATTELVVRVEDQ